MPNACPRCGYDISATKSTWQSECPISGTCPECGLEFAWGDVLGGLGTDPIFFEHARYRYLLSYKETLVRLPRPRRFWAWVRLEWSIDPVRIAVFAAITSLALWVLGILIYAVAYTIACYWSPRMPWGGRFGRSWMGEMVAELGAAALPLFEPDTGFALLYYRGVSGTTLWALSPLAVLGLSACVLMPLAFFVLPQTLRRCRVRPAHLFRVWGYGLPGFVVALQAPRILDFLLVWTGLRWNLGGLGWVQLVLLIVWQSLWWSAASRHYLRLPRPSATTWGMLCISTLACLVVLIVAAPEWTYNGLFGGTPWY